ncbi:hypothetical protein DFH06DRAFT_1467400 [Mycena polygramma]|nr:hypothetical protein DFH06DRAFT_1467400 [Mycena polygramma]
MPPKKLKKPKGSGDPKPRGRPPQKFYTRGKAKAKEALEALFGAASSTSAPDTPGAESTAGGGITLAGDQAREAQLAGEQYGVETQREEASSPIWLQHIKREAEGYILVASVNTEDIPKWFHDQKNDYQPKDHRDSRVVQLKWFGHPGDSPFDARARKFIVRWAPEAPVGSELRDRAIKEKRPVLRWDLSCMGAHDRIPEGEASESDEEGGSGSGSGSDGGSDRGDSPAPAARRNRWAKCSSEVRLQIEVNADDLAIANIWQKGEHEEVSASQTPFLITSRFLRLQIMDRFRRFGAKVTAVQKDLVQQFLLPNSTGTSEALPSHRIPNTKQISAMYTSTKQRKMLARNPFRATWLMVQRNPRDMYYYHPHDFDRPDSESKFTVAITDDFSLDSTIQNTEGPNGTVFFDSTHRLHNQNRAATTIFCTANDGNHVMPGAYLISANIKAQTIKGFFVDTVRKIEARAREIVADPTKIRDRDPKARARILARCQHIVKFGFSLTNINVDKCRSQYNGIVDALKELGIIAYFIRLCQFHVIFAILRFDFDDGSQGLGFAVPLTMKLEILVLFRILQRCRSWDNWEEAKRTFHAGLEELARGADRESLEEELAAEQRALTQPDSEPVKTQCRSKKVPKAKTKKAQEGGKSFLEVVKSYFDKNWFVMPWIPMFTDIGMPPGQSRDDTWNTNNWAETAFKQFNTVFLDNKQNKRIDQLASIILNHHLPFFRYFPTPDRARAKTEIERHNHANRLWETDMVNATAVAEEFVVNRLVGDRAIQYHVVLTPLSCTCETYEQTGKACVDIIAARLLRSNGPASKWRVVEYETEKAGLGEGKTKQKTRAPKLPNDTTVEAQLNSIFIKLRIWEAQEHSRALEPNFGEFQATSSGGRPANAKPLRPWRGRCHDSKVFRVRTNWRLGKPLIKK